MAWGAQVALREAHARAATAVGKCFSKCPPSEATAQKKAHAIETATQLLELLTSKMANRRMLDTALADLKAASAVWAEVTPGNTLESADALDARLRLKVRELASKLLDSHEIMLGSSEQRTEEFTTKR